MQRRLSLTLVTFVVSIAAVHCGSGDTSETTGIRPGAGGSGPTYDAGKDSGPGLFLDSSSSHDSADSADSHPSDTSVTDAAGDAKPDDASHEDATSSDAIDEAVDDGGGEVSAPDADPSDATAADVVSADAVTIDAPSTDAVMTDAVATDAVTTDAAGNDAGTTDATTTDAGAVETGTVDAAPADSGGADADSGSPNTNPGYVDLTPPLGAPLDPLGGKVLVPPAPAGWTYYDVAGAVCRDGSPAGFFVRYTTSDKLLVYFEGGGACTNAGFCNFNPANVNRAISGDNQTVIGSTLGVIDARQQPGVFDLGVVHGIFDPALADNPFKDWNIVYIPYCTGDVHFGSRPNGTVPGVAAAQQFVGHTNTQKFVGRLVPTFKSKVSRVVVSGGSAGSFGAVLNFSMFQDAFGSVRVDALLDSGVAFDDSLMPVCLQKHWRDAWGLDASFPPDCTECFHADGGGMLNLANFIISKHPNSRLAMVSSVQDEVIRLFLSSGVKSCSTYDTADPVAITTGQVLDPTLLFSAATYTAGLGDLRTRYVPTGRFATYYLGGFNSTFHMHIWRTRLTDPFAGTETIAQMLSHFLNGQMDQVGP